MALLRDSNDTLIADASLLSDLSCVLSMPSSLDLFVFEFVRMHGPQWDTLHSMFSSKYTVTHLQILYARELEKRYGKNVLVHMAQNSSAHDV